METNDEAVSMRSIHCEQGSLSNSVGSSTFCQGDTVVTAAVYGPTEIKLESENTLKGNVEVIYQPKSGQSGCYEKLIEHLVKNTCKSVIMLTQYPRSQVVIIIQDMQVGGSSISCCTNAACLALIDAGISLRCLSAAVTCIVTTDDKVVVDPTSPQEKAAKAKMFFAFESQNFKLISSYAKGVFTQEKLQECVSLCRNASKNILQFYQEAVKRKLSKST